MIAWLFAVALAQDASAEAEPEPEPWWQPHPHLSVSAGPDLLVLDRFWRSQGLRAALELELHPGLAVEVAGAFYPLSGPTRLTDQLEAILAAPLIADIGVRGVALGWLRPLVSTTDDWRMVAGVGLGVAGIVPGADSEWIGPIAGPAWGIIGEARRERLSVRTRVEGAAYLAGFPVEQIVLLQLPLWVGIDIGVRLL